MSSYIRRTKHPITGEFEEAEWLDDYYGKHRYGVRFPGSDEVFVADSQEWEFDDRAQPEEEFCEVCGGDHDTGDCSW